MAAFFVDAWTILSMFAMEGQAVSPSGGLKSHA
jgi:hypothetical protein